MAARQIGRKKTMGEQVPSKGRELYKSDEDDAKDEEMKTLSSGFTMQPGKVAGSIPEHMLQVYTEPEHEFILNPAVASAAFGLADEEDSDDEGCEMQIRSMLHHGEDEAMPLSPKWGVGLQRTQETAPTALIDTSTRPSVASAIMREHKGEFIESEEAYLLRKYFARYAIEDSELKVEEGEPVEPDLTIAAVYQGIQKRNENAAGKKKKKQENGEANCINAEDLAALTINLFIGFNLVGRNQEEIDQACIKAEIGRAVPHSAWHIHEYADWFEIEFQDILAPRGIVISMARRS